MELKLLPVIASSIAWVLGGCGASSSAARQPGGELPDPRLAAPAVHVALAPAWSAVTRREAVGPSVQSVEKHRHTRTSIERAPLEPLPPMPEGTTVLHVGDSFAGALGIPLNKRFKEAGITGVLKYRTASFIVEWAHQTDLDDYLSRYQPDLVLVTLGANELGIEEPERRIPAIRKIVEKIGDRPCVWVGAPLWSDDNNGLMDIVRDNAAPCRFMDSTALFPDMPRTPDKIHPTMQAREDWATKVAQWLASHRRPTPNHVWALSQP